MRGKLEINVFFTKQRCMPEETGSAAQHPARKPVDNVVPNRQIDSLEVFSGMCFSGCWVDWIGLDWKGGGETSPHVS